MSRLTAILVLAIAMLFAMGQAVLADDTGYHPEGNSCDAGHGAFGAFSHHFATYDPENPGFNWISADAKEDGGMGHETGPAESGASADCRAAR
jgi:hypothetical protein